MYINDIHILAYIIVFVLGAIVGQCLEWVNKRVINNKKIFSKEIIKELKKKIKINYYTMFSTAILYILVLSRFGLKMDLLENLELIKYLILIPILISIIMIDNKEKIIPNRLTLTLFEAGIAFAFLYSINNIFVARDYLLAALIGFLIFGIIAILGRIIAGKEAMGMGDIKLVAVLGLYFGISLTISISILSFIIAAIITIVIMLRKKGKNNEYIAFGPSICIAALLCIVIPEKTIISVLLTVFTLGKYKI